MPRTKLLQLVVVTDSSSVSLDKYELRLLRRNASECFVNDLCCAGSVIATTSLSSEVSLRYELKLFWRNDKALDGRKVVIDMFPLDGVFLMALDGCWFKFAVFLRQAVIGDSAPERADQLVILCDLRA